MLSSGGWDKDNNNVPKHSESADKTNLPSIYRCVYSQIKVYKIRKRFVLNKLVNISLLALLGGTINMPPTFCTGKQTIDTSLSSVARKRFSSKRRYVHLPSSYTRKKNNTRRESSCYTHKDNPDTRGKTETRSLREIKTKSTYTLEVCGCSLQRS